MAERERRRPRLAKRDRARFGVIAKTSELVARVVRARCATPSPSPMLPACQIRTSLRVMAGKNQKRDMSPVSRSGLEDASTARKPFVMNCRTTEIKTEPTCDTVLKPKDNAGCLIDDAEFCGLPFLIVVVTQVELSLRIGVCMVCISA